MVTSKVSLSPFDSDELSKIQELIGLLQGKRKFLWRQN